MTVFNFHNVKLLHHFFFFRVKRKPISVKKKILFDSFLSQQSYQSKIMSYYDLILNDLINKLQDEGIFRGLLDVLKVTPNPVTKIKVVEEIWLKKGLRPDVLMQQPKNNKTAEKCRKKGNKYYAKKTTNDYLKALKYYNKSICFARSDSKHFSFGFANRSAVYFKLEMYRICLENIEMAKKYGYPERLMEKLNDREAKCLESIANNLSINDEAQNIINADLTHIPNENIPFLVNSLELRRDSELNSTIVTTNDLRVGDIIAIDTAFCVKLSPTLRYQRCEYCLKESYHSLIPCGQCTAVMFCNQACYDEGFNKFHKYECPIIDYINGVMSTSSLCALRTVITAITMFPSYADFCEFIEEHREEDTNLFAIDYQTNSRELQSYGPIRSLTPSKEELSIIFHNVLLTTIFYRLLFFHTSMGQFFSTSRSMEIFVETIYQHLLRFGNNGTALTTLTSVFREASEKNNDVLDEFALGLFPFRSMLNHSCSPNVVCISLGTKLLISVLKPIRAGEELFER